MKLVLKSVVTALIISSCAQMEKDFIKNNCNEESAYSSGMNASNSGKESDVSLYGLCPEESRKAIKQAYLKGYREARTNNSNFKEDVIGFTQYTCKLKPFNKVYQATHPRISIAISIVKRQCEGENHKIHCVDPDCVKQ